MTTKNFSVIFFIFMVTTHANAQGEAVENSYMGDVQAFSKIRLDTFWEYAPDQSVTFNNLNTVKTWQKANPTFLQEANGKLLNWQGIGWFKQTFTVADALKGKTIALQMGHFGASEIYVDGKLIKTYGDLYATSGKDKSFLPRKPTIAQLDSGATHTLVVHYATHSFDKIIQPRIFFGFIVSLAPLADSYNGASLTFIHGIFSSALYATFTLFFFFIFFFYPKRFASLASAIYMLDFAVLFISIMIATNTTDVETCFFGNLIWKTTVALAGTVQILFIYLVYYKKLPLRTWLIVPLTIANFLVVLYPAYTNPLLTGANILVNLEVFRIIFLGVKNKRIGFWILAISTFIGAWAFLIFIADIFHLFPPYYNGNSIVREVGGLVSDLASPLMLSLLFAWEFGSSNRDLQKQLVAVQHLSEENLLKEQEKQHILANQKETLEHQVEARTAELTISLKELKATQTQLIQSEKLASLGELTAGIAHEIQNPLNFVNNFSELSVDLVKDLNEEIHKPNMDKSYVDELLTDLSANQEKINHHGNRASSIVKGMLEHSRASTGVKELTDVNKLCDEYFRLAYHGLRAKDKNFNAEMITQYDPTNPKIEIIPQDVGRVILNIINNAFYAVTQRKNNSNLTNNSNLLGLGNDRYQPTVTVETRHALSNIEIKISDNGTGMPESVKEKIFQPFFTTKPTGQGTGLGLSLAYDIITKGHGGTLKVESTEGVGTEFVISLPI